MMRTHSPLAVVDILAASTLLIILSMQSHRSDNSVLTSTVIQASKNTNSEFATSILADQLEAQQKQNTLLRSICYTILIILVINTIFWTIEHLRLPSSPSSPPSEPRSGGFQ